MHISREPISKSKQIRLVVQPNHFTSVTATRGISNESQLHHICIRDLANISKTSLPICRTRNLIGHTHQLSLLRVPLSLRLANSQRRKLIKQYEISRRFLIYRNVGGWIAAIEPVLDEAVNEIGASGRY